MLMVAGFLLYEQVHLVSAICWSMMYRRSKKAWIRR